MKKSDVFPSKYLKAENLAIGGGKYTTMVLTIAGIDTSEPFDDGKTQRMLHFEEDGRTLGLNATNWDAIASITGKDDDEDWKGCVIELYVDPRVRFGNKTVPAIRVREADSGPVRTNDGAQAKTKDAPPLDKAGAWAAWKGHDKSADPASNFKAAVERVEKESGKKRDAFNSQDWTNVVYSPSAVIDDSDIPF
jgi:hypothetical protein